MRLALALALLGAAGLARADSGRLVVTASAVDLGTPDPHSDLVQFGPGAGVSALFLFCGCHDNGAAVEIGGTVLRGADGAEIDLFSLTTYFSFPMDHAIAPYISFGLDVAATSIDGEGGLGLGAHGGVGVHGLVGKRFYWRAGAGYLGAGPGGVVGQVAVGWALGKL
jgi:hypothetical protein